MDVQGPFYTLARAAEYCGYSADGFRRLLIGYTMPKYGPKKNRYARSVLDRFMTDPVEFQSNVCTNRRRKLQPVVVRKPIEH